MPALIPTDTYGIITWLGRVQNRAAGVVSAPIAEVALTFAGMPGEEHGGLTRPACLPQNAVQSPRGSGLRWNCQLQRPTKPVLLRMLSSIHDETDPHKTRVNPGRFEKS